MPEFNHSEEILDALQSKGPQGFGEAIEHFSTTFTEGGFSVCKHNKGALLYKIGGEVKRVPAVSLSNPDEEMPWYIIVVELLSESKVYFLITNTPVLKERPPRRQEPTIMVL